MTVAVEVAGWARDLLEVLTPAGCVACGGWIPGGRSTVCGLCRTRLREPSWPRCPRCHHPRGSGRGEGDDCLACRDWPTELRAVRYRYLLEPPATDIVHALKYEGWHEVAGLVGDAVADVALAECVAPEALVVPVPTTARRRAERGYNQAELIARRVGARLARPVVSALERPSAAASQTALGPTERKRNVRGAFRLADGAHLKGRDVLLVDDVLTTGSTVVEAAVELVGSGARSVRALTFARALPGARDTAA